MKATTFWYAIEDVTADFFQRLTDAFASIPFDEERGFGFRIDSIGEQILLCQFIRKESFLETVEDPFGNTIETQRVKFHEVFFNILREGAVIELINPGKNITRILNSIEKYSGFRLRLLKPDLSKIIESIESTAEDFKVMSINTANFLIRSRTNCVIKFQSIVDVRSDVAHFLQKRNFTIGHIKLIFLMDGHKYRIEGTESGKFILNFSFASTGHENFRKCILDCVDLSSPKPI